MAKIRFLLSSLFPADGFPENSYRKNRFTTGGSFAIDIER